MPTDNPYASPAVVDESALPVVKSQQTHKPMVRFSRGFLWGCFVGVACIAFGFVSWGVSTLIFELQQVDRADSRRGISLLFMYVLSFGLAGGVLGMFEANNFKRIKSWLAWILAILTVVFSCYLCATLIHSRAKTVDVWGMGSGIVLFAILTFAAVMVTLNRRRRLGASR